MSVKSNHGVFPDYLSLTYHPDKYPREEMIDLLIDLDFARDKKVPQGVELWRTPDHVGVANIRTAKRWVSLAFSGNAIDHVRGVGAVGNLLQVLTVDHHRVTRLDLAKDVPMDSPETVQAELARIWQRAKRGTMRLGRKQVIETKASRIQSNRRDGVCSGTVYVGSRRDRYMAKVYDKRAEVWAKRDLDIMRELLRYEVTARKGNASLRDFLEPDPLFFHLASPDLLPAPEDTARWRYTEMDPLELPPLAQLTDHEKLIRLIENSPDLETLAALIAAKPAELPLVIRKIKQRLEHQVNRAA